MFDTLTYATKLDIELVRRDTKLDIELVRRDLKELELKFEGQFVLLKWMLGFVLVCILSIVLKTFFIP